MLRIKITSLIACLLIGLASSSGYAGEDDDDEEDDEDETETVVAAPAATGQEEQAGQRGRPKRGGSQDAGQGKGIHGWVCSATCSMASFNGFRRLSCKRRKRFRPQGRYCTGTG